MNLAIRIIENIRYEGRNSFVAGCDETRSAPSVLYFVPYCLQLPFSGRFLTKEIKFHIYEIEFHTSEIQFHTSEIQFHTSENQFHTNEIQFHTN